LLRFGSKSFLVLFAILVYFWPFPSLSHSLLSLFYVGFFCFLTLPYPHQCCKIHQFPIIYSLYLPFIGFYR
jgi:hypothetical protein